MTVPPPLPDPHSVRLIGAGGHAGVVVASARRSGLVVEAVVDTDPERIGRPFGDLIIQPDEAGTAGPHHAAIGSNRLRRAVVADHPEASWVSIVDPTANLAEDVDLGDGVLIGLGARVQTGVRIGRHAIINTGAIVEHDCVIGDFAHVAPGVVLTGAVQVGEGALIGAGAVVLPGLTIGDWATVGAGSVVTESVAAGVTVAGSPARVLQSEVG